MADILNAGALFLVAGFCVVAIVGAADQLRQDDGPASSALDGAATSEVEPSQAPEVRSPIHAKHALDDDRDKRGDRERDDGRRDKGGDNRGDDEDDEDDDHGDDERDGDDDD